MYIQQAYKGDNTTWKVLLTTFMVLFIFIANLVMFFTSDIDTLSEMDKMYEMVPSNNFWLLVNLSFFVFLLLMLFGLVVYLHQRSLVSLTTSRKKIDYKRIAFAFGLVFTIQVVSFVVEYYMNPGSIVLDFKPVSFIILVLLSLVLFPFQIGLEEYVFRGFLMQQIGIVAKNRWFPLIITSVTFGLLHSANPEVATMGGITMIFYIGTGLLLGVMTLMDEGLELALGFHFANNFLAATLVTAEYSALRTDSLFKYVPNESEITTFWDILLPILISYPIIIFVLAKKYKWKNWKSRLFGRVPEKEASVVIDEK